MTVISVLAGGKILAKETGSEHRVDGPAEDTTKAVTVTMNDLRVVETILNINLTLGPSATASVGEPVSPTIGAYPHQNVVGFTVVGVSTMVGCTITPEVSAVGYA